MNNEIDVKIQIDSIIDNKSTDNFTITVSKTILVNGIVERTEKEDIIIQKGSIIEGY